MSTRQEAGDNSYNVNAGGSVHIVSGLSVADTKEIVRDMLRDQMSGLQAEAKNLVEHRNEELMDQFLELALKRFGQTLEQNLGRLRDPGAQYALRSAQLNYCWYGDKESRNDALDILVERLSEDRPRLERIVLDEAIEVVARLDQNQIDLLCFYMLALRYTGKDIINGDALLNYLGDVAQFQAGLSVSEAGLGMMTSQGVLTQLPGLKNWISFYDVLRRNYWALLVRGAESPEHLGIDRKLHLPQPVLATGVSKISRYNPSSLQEEPWRQALQSAGLNNETTSIAIEKVNALMMTADTVKSYFLENEIDLGAVWDSFGDQEKPLAGYTPTPVGAAIALARLTRDGIAIPFALANVI